jgi:hypothetical protein
VTPGPEQPPTPARILRFAGEASIGVVYLQDEDLIVPEIVKGFEPGHAHADLEEFSRAQGEIHIPAGKRVTLCLRGPGVTPQRYLAAIESLGPDDLYGLQFFSPQPIRLDDSLIAPLAKLTGCGPWTLAASASARRAFRSWRGYLISSSSPRRRD